MTPLGAQHVPPCSGTINLTVLPRQLGRKRLSPQEHRCTSLSSGHEGCSEKPLKVLEPLPVLSVGSELVPQGPPSSYPTKSLLQQVPQLGWSSSRGGAGLGRVWVGFEWIFQQFWCWWFSPCPSQSKFLSFCCFFTESSVQTHQGVVLEWERSQLGQEMWIKR